MNLNHNKLELHPGDTITINASEKVSWSSYNDFVASVNSEGQITAMHVGETDIVATCNNGSGLCHIIVVPRFTKEFQEPIHDFSLNKTDIKKKASGTLKKDNNNMLLYYMDDNGYEQVSYSFDEKSGKLKTALVRFEFPFFEKYAKYLSERYQVGNANKEDGSVFIHFIDAMKLDEAKIVITLAVIDHYLCISYQSKQ